MQLVADVKTTKSEDPRYLSALHLEKLGVTRLNRHNLHLRCKHCGEVWSPRLNADATLPAGYWRCPNGCNR
ncbi:MAG: hypothetical protein LC114_18330 [Bryobacterales bacterium]|nr:hypothetical protein [Bryobacterales bacterium]